MPVYEDGQLAGSSSSSGSGSSSSGWSVGDVSTTLSPAFLYRLGGDRADYSGYGNDLTNAAGTLTYVQAYGKQWGYFDGSNLLTAGSQAEHEYAGDHTMFVQMMFMRQPTSTSQYILLRGSQNSSASADNTLYGMLLWSTFRAVFDSGEGDAYSEIAGALTPSYMAGVPFTFGITFDASGGNYSYYFNGKELETDTTASSPSGGGDTSLWIGGSDTGAQLQNCALRNVAGWSSTLAASQMADVHAEAMG